MFEELIKKLTSILRDVESESIRFHVPEIVSVVRVRSVADGTRINDQRFFIIKEKT